MLIRIIAKALGGIWVLRRKYNNTNIGWIKKLYSFIYHYYLKENGSWISLSAKFRCEPCFPHGTHGVFISGGATVGSNCIIFQQVTIGSNTLIDSKGIGAPAIGNNCYIGVGVKIIGNLKIGNNVRIGANTVVYRDVPDNCVVISGSQKIIEKDTQLNNRFYHMKNGAWHYYDMGEWHKVTTSNELTILEDRFKPAGSNDINNKHGDKD